MSNTKAYRDRPADTRDVRLTDFDVLAFDCYGTLIDWEGGIYTALQPLLARMPAPPSRDAALELFAREESAQEAETPAMIYSELLSVVHGRVARMLGLPVDAAEAKAFGASVPAWPAFPDSAEALAYLKRHFKLVILSNVDRESFRGSNARLGVAFDAIYTAQDVGSYKPSPRNFDYLLAKITRRPSAPGCGPPGSTAVMRRRVGARQCRRRKALPTSSVSTAWPTSRPPMRRRCATSRCRPSHRRLRPLRAGGQRIESGCPLRPGVRRGGRNGWFG